MWGLITHFLRGYGIDKEEEHMTISRHANLTGMFVDVTRTKSLDTSHRPVLSVPDR